MDQIHFFIDNIPATLRDRRKLKSWIKDAIEREGGKLDEVNIVLTSDEQLRKINKDFLKHDYYTDIVTFQYSTDVLSGELYISYDRVKENARNLGNARRDEIHRVIIHGILHMLGFKDKTKADKEIMRAREDFYLTLRDF